MNTRRILLAALAIGIIGSQAIVAFGNVRLRFPEESPGVPAYTPIQRHADGTPYVFTDGEWVAIPFHRDPACVPSDFNLLDLVSFAAFSCPLTVQGFMLWKNGPALDPFPLFIQSRGNAVPMWFVTWTDFQAAAADDELTKAELLATPSLITGNASIYTEMLDFGIPVLASSYTISSTGTLADGRSFHFSVTEEKEVASRFKHILISFE